MKNLKAKLAVTATASTIIGSLTIGANAAQATSLWQFNEASIVADSVGLNDGSYIGGIVPNNGVITLNGTNQYITVPNASSLNFGAGDLLVAARLLTTSAQSTGIRMIVDKRREASGVTQGYAFFLVNGNLGFQLSNGINAPGSTTPFANYVTNISVADGNFHDLLVTVDRDQANGLNFFVDGALRATFNPTGEAGSLDNTLPLTIGRRSDSADAGFFNGSLDYVCVSGGLNSTSCATPLTSYAEKPNDFAPKLFTGEIRIGGITTYEAAIGRDGAQISNTGTIERNWVNNQPVNWTLNWNPATNTASFQLTNPNSQTISYTFTPQAGESETFNGLCLLAKSLEADGRVAAGSISQVNVNSMTILKTNGNSFTTNTFNITPNATNGGPTTLTRTATAGTGLASQLQQACYGFGSTAYQEITQLRGTALMSWPVGPIDPITASGGAQSHMTLQIKGYDPIVASSSITAADDPQSVPEPKSITGLLALGLLGTVSTLKRKQ